MSDNHDGTEPEQPLVDIGWLIVGVDGASERLGAIEEARSRFAQCLAGTFPSFHWRVTSVHQPEQLREPQIEPTRLLEHGAVERDLRRWDYVFLFTNAELKDHGGGPSVAAPSRALGASVISSSRIPATGGGTGGDEAATVLGLTLTLMMHLVTGERTHETGTWRDPLALVAKRDHIDPALVEPMRDELARVADPRLEEEPSGSSGRRVVFYLRAVSRNWRPVVHAIRSARPWLLPLRLSRITAAAVATIVILTTTAESWDLAASNDLPTLAALALLALVATVAFVITRQRLVLGRDELLAEQAVVTRVSVLGVVTIGLAVTFVLLTCMTLAMVWMLFPRELVDAWVTGPGPAVDDLIYLQLALLLSAIGLVVGALGASFEDQEFVRHVAYVDEPT